MVVAITPLIVLEMLELCVLHWKPATKAGDKVLSLVLPLQDKKSKLDPSNSSQVVYGEDLLSVESKDDQNCLPWWRIIYPELSKLMSLLLIARLLPRSAMPSKS